MLNAYHFYFLANFLYRWGIPVLPSVIKLIIFLIYNSSIPFQCELGKGTRFAYGGIGVVLHKRCRLGENCMIGSNVTVGGRSGLVELPIIGDNVYIATGAKVLGDVVIGNNVTIGANAVVINNIPANAIVAGIPAKVIKYRGDV